MNKIILTLIFAALLAFTTSAQKIAKPTLTSAVATPAQKMLINQGIALHDAKRYDEAIAKYREVLTANPGCTLAIYELGMSYYYKGDKLKAMETGQLGAKYISEELPLFYQLMGNLLDEQGKSAESVKIHLDAMKMLEGDSKYAHHMPVMHYNLALNYYRQKKYLESRAELKKSIELNPGYASPHGLLALVFQGGGYKIPAMLAAARFISLEHNTARTQRSAIVLAGVLKAPQKDGQTGNINIFMDMNAPRDEGDFGMYDLLLGTLMVADPKEDKGKSENDLFAEAIDTMITLLSGDKKLTKTFVGKNYVPFLIDMKKLGHTKTFAYLVRYQTGNADALKWLTANEKQLTAFVDWSKSYQLPK